MYTKHYETITYSSVAIYYNTVADRLNTICDHYSTQILKSRYPVTLVFQKLRLNPRTGKEIGCRKASCLTCIDEKTLKKIANDQLPTLELAKCVCLGLGFGITGFIACRNHMIDCMYGQQNVDIYNNLQLSPKVLMMIDLMALISNLTNKTPEERAEIAHAYFLRKKLWRSSGNRSDN